MTRWNVFGPVWVWLREDKTPRWLVILGMFLTLLIAVGTQLYTASRSDEQFRLSRIDARAAEVRQIALDFQTYAAAYVHAVLQDSPDLAQSRERLRANIVAQDTAVDLSEDLLGSSAKVVADDYRAALSRLMDTLPKVEGVLSMGPFWEATSDVLVARDRFLAELNEAASAG